MGDETVGERGKGGEGEGPSVLALDGIVVRADRRTILNVADFRIAAGERVAVIGPNGAGKTTLLHVAALLRRPDAGRIALLGNLVSAADGGRARRAISVVFQAPLLFDTSVLANAAAGLRFAGASRAEAERTAREWLERFGVGHLAQRRARRLSGGEAGRVALARAFATAPALLLLDEPFSALDAPTRAALLPELASRLRDTGAAAILVTHDLEEAFAFGDRIAVMNEGRIVADGAPADLLARPPTREAAELLGTENVLPTTVHAVAGRCVSLALRPGGPLLQVVASFNQNVLPGQTVTLVFPAAAAFAIGQDDSVPMSWNRIEGIVIAAKATPTGFRITATTPDPIVAMAPWHSAALPQSAGEPVAIVFPPEAAHLIDEPAAATSPSPRAQGDSFPAEGGSGGSQKLG